MADLKLAKLPDRTPIKLGISILPELNEGNNVGSAWVTFPDCSFN